MSARFVSEFNVVLRKSKDAQPIEDRATAHELTLKGFKLETQEQIPLNTVLHFTLELNDGETAAGQGRVATSDKTTLASWANVEITSMPWGEKRKLKRLLYPDSVDWPRLFDLCFKLVMSMTVVITCHRIYRSPELRGVFIAMLPKAIALFVMGWAFLGMIKREPRR